MGCVESSTAPIKIQNINQIKQNKTNSHQNVNNNEQKHLITENKSNVPTKTQIKVQSQIQSKLTQVSFEKYQLIGVGSYLQQLFQLIIGNKDLGSILGIQVFEHLKTKIKNCYTSDENKKQIVIILEQYIKFASEQLRSNAQESQILLNIQLFIEKFSQKSKKIFNILETKGDWILSALYYFRSFETKKFQPFEMKNTMVQVKKEYQCEGMSMFYLSLFFVKYCQKLEKSGTNIAQINSKLKEYSELFKNFFSVQNKRKYDLKQSGTMCVLLKAYYKRLFQEEVDKKFKQKIIKVVGDKKEQILQKQILSMVEFAKKTHSFFDQIVYDACMNNEGFGFKSNLKLRSAEDKSSLVRVKQKLLKDKFKNYKKPLNCKNMKELRQKQEQAFEQQLKTIFNSLSEIKFTVSDLLRGKCLFSEQKCIYNAAISILERVKEQSSKGHDISIVQFDNRLQGITQDLVLKIRIQELVCEFQLVLTFSESQNAIHHKMYELVRSKTLSPTTLLYQWNQKGVNTFIRTCEKYIKIHVTRQQYRKQILNKLIKFSGYNINDKVYQDQTQLKVVKNNMIDEIKRNGNQVPKALQRNRQLLKNGKLGNTYMFFRLIKQNSKVFQLIQKNYKFTNIPNLADIKNQKQVLEVCQYYKSVNIQLYFKLLKELSEIQKQKNREQTLFYGILLKKIGEVLLTIVIMYYENRDESTKLLQKARKYFQECISIFSLHQIEHQLQIPNPHHVQALSLLIQIKHYGIPKFVQSCDFKLQAFKLLKMTQKVFGNQSTKYAQALIVTAQQLNKSGTQIQFYKKSLLILQNALGYNHQDTLLVLYKMRKLYGDMHISQYWNHYNNKIENLISRLSQFKGFKLINDSYDYCKFKKLIDPSQKDKKYDSLKLKQKLPTLKQMLIKYQYL